MCADDCVSLSALKSSLFFEPPESNSRITIPNDHHYHVDALPPACQTPNATEASPAGTLCYRPMTTRPSGTDQIEGEEQDDSLKRLGFGLLERGQSEGSPTRCKHQEGVRCVGSPLAGLMAATGRNPCDCGDTAIPKAALLLIAKDTTPLHTTPLHTTPHQHVPSLMKSFKMFHLTS